MATNSSEEPMPTDSDTEKVDLDSQSSEAARPEATLNHTEPVESDNESEKKDDLDWDDFIDEVMLKDQELSLSNEEKELRRSEAEQLKDKGNQQFKEGEFRESAITYTLALRTCPLSFHVDRSKLYSNRAASKMKLGLSKSAIEDCNESLELNPCFVRALWRRAQLYETTEKLDEALEDCKKILELDPSHKEANYAARRLPDLISERNEKLKTEMMSKLKDLGNLFLRPFGLSTENFQINQDSGSGGYSINFKQS